MDWGAVGHTTMMSLAAEASPDEPGASGRVASFEVIYERHFDFVWRSLRRLGVPDPALDDATQEVFLVVHRRLSEFAGRSSLKTWLFAIALHVAQRVFRTQARRPTHELTEDVPSDHSPQDDVLRHEAVRLVYSILDRLPPEKRAVFVMAELEQFTVPEIAEATRTPLNTVYARLRAARLEFETHLERAAKKERWREP
jgi:RNA polymerase sigma-70 factor, ECF subfamily